MVLSYVAVKCLLHQNKYDILRKGNSMLHDCNLPNIAFVLILFRLNILLPTIKFYH